jgi:hypothetical protein
MYILVTFNMRLPTECFLTNVTGIRTLATMDKLVSLNFRLLIECFFTNITVIRTLATMYKLVSFNMRLPTEWFFYEPYRHKDTGHYV